MTFRNNNRVLLYGVLFILLLVMVNSFAGRALAANIVSLSVYEGYRFLDGSVTKSGDESADLSFYVNMGRRNARSFALATLGAKKIKEFGKEKPDVKSLSLEAVNEWQDYANAPAQGYYVVLGADGKSLYLVNLISFKNQGRAASYWKLNFSWEKI